MQGGMIDMWIQQFSTRQEMISIDLAVNYVKPRYRFAHKVDVGEHEQFNCYVWDHEGQVWRETAAQKILAEIKDLEIQDLRKTKQVATEAVARITGDDQTLQVEIDDAYKAARTSMIIAPGGKYWDLPEGKVRDIDPSTHFFDSLDVRFELDAGAPEPAKWLQFMKDRFGAQWAIVRDHWAAQFLPSTMLNRKDGEGRPKMLFIVGKSKTWKSTAINIIADTLTEGACANVGLAELQEKFGAGPASLTDS